MPRTLCSLTLIALLALPAMASAQQEFKIATVAPNGSAWMRIFNVMKDKIEKETGGAVKLRFYPGQVQGDERDVVRKIRTGQLQGGSFTTVGLSMINTEVLVLQMPLMFPSYESLDKVRTALKKTFQESFRKHGFELLGWSDVGWVYLLSNQPVDSAESLKKQKVWVWQDDPLTKALMREAGVSPRLLGLPQVYPALNTGMVNTVYNAPLATLTLQWHTQVKYFTDFPLAIAIGATVVDKKVFDKLTPEQQTKVLDIAEKHHEALTKRVRKDNDKALGMLREAGLKPVPVSEANKKKFYEISMKVANAFAPRYYPKELLEQVLKLRK